MNAKPQKSSTDSISSADAFWLEDLYPDAKGLLTHEHIPLSNIKDDCIVALDANALLFPLEFSSESVSAVEKVYTQLARKKRLIVPAQAVREFYKHRSQKISEIVEALGGVIKKARRQIFEQPIPILESNKDYQEARNLGKEIINKGKRLEEKLTLISQQLKDGIGSDPVSVLYRKVLGNSVCNLKETEKLSRENIIKEVERRARLDIAPGFKDKSKEDGGIGDYIIWATILQEAEATKKHCIFVTEEEKADWWIKKNGTFQPRPELIDEYRRASDGKSLHLLPLSGLLSQFDAEQTVVKQVQDLEKEQKELVIKVEKTIPSQTKENKFIEKEIKLLSNDLQSISDKIKSINSNRSNIFRKHLVGDISDKEYKKELIYCEQIINKLMNDYDAIKSELDYLKYN